MQTAQLEGMETELAPTRERVAQKFPALLDPKTNRSHRISYAVEKTPEGGAPIDLVVELRQGYVDEETQGDLLMSWPHKDVEDETEYKHTIPANVARDITNYENLWLCMVANQR